MEISDVHEQVTATHPSKEMLVCSKTQQPPERKLRPHPGQALKCPRCDSTNTKFCYYNNYSLSQPRYFCKGCRRYWTQGGTLRNVPVGGGSRKNKRSYSSSSSSKQYPTANSNAGLPSLIPPLLSYDPSDLTLAFASLHQQPITTKQLGLDDYDTFLLGNPNPNPNTNSFPTAPSNGFLDILRSGFVDTTGPSGGIHNLYYGFGGNGNGEGGVSGEEVMLPFEGGFGGGATTTTTQGSCCKVMDGGENKLLMGLQWPVEGDGTMVMESGRDTWNGVGSSWHGPLNSSLM